MTSVSRADTARNDKIESLVMRARTEAARVGVTSADGGFDVRWPEDPVGLLVALWHVRSLLDGMEDVVVPAARQAGLTWEQIAYCLGVSKGTVTRRWGPDGRLNGQGPDGGGRRRRYDREPPAHVTYRDRRDDFDWQAFRDRYGGGDEPVSSRRRANADRLAVRQASEDVQRLLMPRDGS